MVEKTSEIREEILKLNPMASLYWDENFEIWIFCTLAKSQELHLPSYDWTINKSGNLPEAEEFPDLKGMKKLVLNGLIIGYVMSYKDL